MKTIVSILVGLFLVPLPSVIASPTNSHAKPSVNVYWTDRGVGQWNEHLRLFDSFDALENRSVTDAPHVEQPVPTSMPAGAPIDADASLAMQNQLEPPEHQVRPVYPDEITHSQQSAPERTLPDPKTSAEEPIQVGVMRLAFFDRRRDGFTRFLQRGGLYPNFTFDVHVSIDGRAVLNACGVQGKVFYILVPSGNHTISIIPECPNYASADGQVSQTCTQRVSIVAAQISGYKVTLDNKKRFLRHTTVRVEKFEKDGKAMKWDTEQLRLANGAYQQASSSASSEETPEQAIRRINKGANTLLPPASVINASGTGHHVIRNRTGHTISVYYAGPVSRAFTIPDGEVRDFYLPAGDYEEACEVPGTPITPLFRQSQFGADKNYEEEFLLQTSSLP